MATSGLDDKINIDLWVASKMYKQVKDINHMTTIF